MKSDIIKIFSDVRFCGYFTKLKYNLINEKRNFNGFYVIFLYRIEKVWYLIHR